MCPSTWSPPPHITFGWANGVNLTRPTGLCTIKHPVSPLNEHWLEFGESLFLCVSQGSVRPEDPIFGIALCVRVLLWACTFMHALAMRRRDRKRVSFGRCMRYPSIHFFILSAQWGNALGGVGIVGRGGKHGPPRVISFHLALFPGLNTADSHTHTSTQYKNAFIFRENPSPSRWHPHRCCHTLELGSRMGEEGWRVS